MASIPIKEQLLSIIYVSVVRKKSASIPIKEQLLWITLMNIKEFNYSFNSYKGTIVIDYPICLDYQEEASIPIKEQLLSLS